MAIVYQTLGSTTLATVADTDNLVIGEGSATIVSNLDQSGLATGLKSVDVLPGFTGNIGNAGTVFQADIDGGSPNTFNYRAGGGACYFRPKGGTNLCTTLWVNSAGRFYAVGGGTITTAGMVKGYLSIADEVIATTLWMGGGECVQGYNATANTTLTVEGGTLTTGRTATTAYIGSGATVIFRDAQSQANRITSTTMYISGRVVWCGGNIATVNLIGDQAVLDMSAAPNNLTITTLNGSAQSLRRSVLESAQAGATVTISTTNAYGGKYTAISGMPGGI